MVLYNAYVLYFYIYKFVWSRYLQFSCSGIVLQNIQRLYSCRYFWSSFFQKSGLKMYCFSYRWIHILVLVMALYSDQECVPCVPQIVSYSVAVLFSFYFDPEIWCGNFFCGMLTWILACHVDMDFDVACGFFHTMWRYGYNWKVNIFFYMF